MRMVRLVLLGFLAGLLLLSACGQQQFREQDILITLDSLEHKLEWLEYQVTLKTWDFYVSGQSDSLQFYRNLYNELVSDEAAFNQLVNGRVLLSEEIDQARCDKFLTAFLYGRVEDDFDIGILRDSLTGVEMTFRAEFEGEKRSRSYLYTIQRNDPNRRRRESAFRARTSIGDELADGLSQLFRLRNQKSRRLGYNNFMALVFSRSGLDLDEYRRLLNHLDSLTRDVYLDIVDRIGVKLNVNDLEYWDVGYAYADINPAVDSYFPADSQLPYIRRTLRALDFNLDKMPIYFDLDTREGKSQFTASFPVKPPYDVRVMGNQSPGMWSTFVLFHEIGHAIHFASVAQESPAFGRFIDGCWTEGMAQILPLMLEEKEWLQKYAKMPAALADSYLASLKEQEVISLRIQLLRLNFEYEAYANPNRDLNKLYWDLFDKYMLLPRHDDVKPWATVTHFISVPVYMQNYLYADIIAAQTWAWLKENYGSPVDNPKVSAFLIQNFYRFGGRYDWRELLVRGTGEEFNPEYMIDRLGL